MQVFDLIQLIQGLDYSAIFLLTFVSAVLIIVPIPYFPVLMTAVLVTDLDPNLIILYGALGAVTAKSIVYMISYYGTNIGNLKKNFNAKEYPETFSFIRYSYNYDFRFGNLPHIRISKDHHVSLSCRFS